ncbi:MAG: energy-coupling factor transporter transmembrane protein EcfT [Firmicutes bacterium]|nr:energy-coupling factor transporter transmembrane protein EcfT [Bacillota bacterium]
MLKDITLGQHFPGNSVLHRLDAMIKIILSMLYLVLIFLVKGFVGYGLLAIFVFCIILLSTVPIKFVLKGLKPLLIFIIFTAILNLFMTSGTVIWQWSFLKLTYEGIYFAVFMILRIVFLVLGTSLLTYTTSPIALTDGIERFLTPFAKIGAPTHELAMMMSIALRFIPTLLEETDKIMKAQMARGADFESGNLIKRARALIPLLVPLFISAFRRADELAIAMECRCYQGGKNRTRLNVVKVGKIDIIASLVFLLCAAVILTANLAG